MDSVAEKLPGQIHDTYESPVHELCFHCGEEVPPGTSWTILLEDKPRHMCCPGCLAVAETILDYGLDNFYRYRKNPSIKPEETVPQDLYIYDDESLQNEFITCKGSLASATLSLDNIVCPACSWLIESQLSTLNGIKSIAVNYSNRRATIEWDREKIKLSEILKSIFKLGYRAWPYDPESEQLRLTTERNQHLRKLGIAGLLGMQVMMLSVALYIGDWRGMQVEFRAFFYWLCFILTTPVMFYSGADFFRRAWRDIRVAKPGMDVPVSLALLIAYSGSTWNTLSGSGHVYYDSIVMFIFLLLLSRHLELDTRNLSLKSYETMNRIIPMMATVLKTDGTVIEHHSILASKLQPGDRVLCKPGETICTDGIVMQGESSIDESIITGESQPVFKQAGDRVVAGSVNIDSPLELDVSRSLKNSTLTTILELVQRAKDNKAHIARLSGKIAMCFICAVIIITACTAIFWIITDSARVIPVTLAVLVITCPCALSLATPLALVASSAALLRNGVAVLNDSVLESLPTVSCYVFDKTGTLTEGKPGLVDMKINSTMGRDYLLKVGASLEKHSEHPLAKAIINAAPGKTVPLAENVKNFPGKGLQGTVNGKTWYLGSGAFISEMTGLNPDSSTGEKEGSLPAQVILADESDIHCKFGFEDQIRTGSADLIKTLKAQHKRVILLSGDSSKAVSLVARKLCLDEYYAGQSPELKQARIRSLINDGEIVAMVGDGVNDAPVLATAHFSFSMGNAVDLSKSNSDIILLNNKLDSILKVIKLSRRTMRIITQNIGWALIYNIIALPLAVSGTVAPWMAAVGMSTSSLIVVMNSRRLWFSKWK